MDNQFIQSPINILKLIVVAIVLVMIVCIGLLGIYWQQNSDPYIKEVLSSTGNLTNGQAIFQINCAGCHASQVNGSVGPSLSNVGKRKSRVEIIQQVISGKTPPMPKFQPNPQEMADLLNYLEKLS